MKTYPKEKFHFLENDRKTKKEPKEGEYYHRWEYRKISKFPFFKKYVIQYKLIDNVWQENDRC